ncbi:MAG: T9SS type A sorting domain-containing protein [Chitinophagaceae bacterium]|nr:T9SS type A sorting domain-containing protein [Chitinophagaceae bacterium]
MKNFLTSVIILSISIYTNGQNNYGKTVLLGYDGLIAEFNGTNRPYVKRLMPPYTAIVLRGLSSISDSTTGRPLFFCNSRRIFDTLGNTMDNGDRLVDSFIYNPVNAADLYPQNSIILPLGNKRFFVAIANITDSSINHCFNGTQCLPIRSNSDDWRYNIVDMNMNGGAGKVVVKNQHLLYKTFLKAALQTAVRHANGRDWWLLKPANDSVPGMYRFLISSDSIIGPMFQPWDDIYAPAWNYTGQLSFSVDGTKLASVTHFTNKLVTGDFDRCTGLLSNRKEYNIPYDTLIAGIWMDSISMGVAYSLNNRFIYVSRYANVLQLDTQETDSNLAWYLVKENGDSITPAQPNINYCTPYSTLFNGPDGRIYVGHITSGCPYLGISVIDYPNQKGALCGWCNQCLPSPAADTIFPSSFSNQPNYNLGPTSNPNCFPSNVPSIPLVPTEFTIYPNPSFGTIEIRSSCKQEGYFQLYDLHGKLVYKNVLKPNETQTLQLPVYLLNGLYTYRCTYPECTGYYGKLSLIR